MSAVPADSAAARPSPGLWALGWARLRRDRLGMASLAVVLLFAALTLATGAGWLASDWEEQAGPGQAPPFTGRQAAQAALAALAAPQAPADASAIADPLADVLAEIASEDTQVQQAQARAQSGVLLLGTDRWGRDVAKKTLRGTQTSMWVGLLAAALAVGMGTVFGALAGYHGGRMDDFFNWLYSVFTSVPYLLLILAIAAVLNQKGTATVVLILGLTGWTGVFRIMRAEYLKHRVREYVRAAEALGASHARRMFVHILPNLGHVVLVQLSLHAVSFMKSEVVLSFLGFGVGVDEVSWGSMLGESQSEILLGQWWQLAAATAAMAVLVTAFSLMTDALRDALDPRLGAGRR